MACSICDNGVCRYPGICRHGGFDPRVNYGISVHPPIPVKPAEFVFCRGCDDKADCSKKSACFTAYVQTGAFKSGPIDGNCATPLSVDPRTQPSNPKQAFGDTKLPLYLVPFSFVAHVSVALYEGMRKYGLVNWRAAEVEAMTYVSALNRHIAKWVNGEKCDPVTKVPHLASAAACLCIVIDAEVNGTLIDNRPLPIPTDRLEAMIADLELSIAHLKTLHADKDPKHYYIADLVEHV